MPGDLALPVTMPVNSLDDLLVPFSRVVQNALREDRIKRRPVGESLALRYLGDMVTFMEMISMAGDKIVIAQNDLAFDIRPDGLLANPPGDELAVFPDRFGPRPAELAENPIRREARMRIPSSSSS